MRIRGIIWLHAVVEKIAVKHGVDTDEVHEVCESRPQIRKLQRGKVEGEDLYAAYGRTDAGRLLTVIFIRKAGNRALVITARDMDAKERRQYGR